MDTIEHTTYTFRHDKAEVENGLNACACAELHKGCQYSWIMKPNHR